MYLYDGISLQNGRTSNMDSLLLSEREIEGYPVLLAVVCDGVGSMEHGAVAASLAVRWMNEWFDGLCEIDRIGLHMRDEVLHINNQIIEAAKRQSLKTATTLTALLFVADKFYEVHIGDTRAYSFDHVNAMEQLTIDDVSETGKLTGCIGRYENPVLLCSEGTCDGKVFLICSDGLYKRVNISSVIGSTEVSRRKEIKKVLLRLADIAIENGEKDNISIALVIVKKEV